MYDLFLSGWDYETLTKKRGWIPFTKGEGILVLVLKFMFV